jgi:hypothetical protein
MEWALPFAEAVVEQVAHPLGTAPSADPAGAERAVGGRVVGLLEGSVAGASAAAEAAAGLSNDPAMLAAFFQNLDLLDRRTDARTDAVALLVLSAMERLAAAA